MEPRYNIFLSIISILGIALGLLSMFSVKWKSAFNNPNTKYYGTDRFLRSARPIGAGLMALILVGMSLIPFDTRDHSEYTFAYVFLAVGIACIVFALISYSSDKVNAAIWKQSWHGDDPERDRKLLFWTLIFMGALFLFVFFLVYPPFLKYG
jgi:heme/copper-type cytochrome/quinol oxidase subunit 2